MSHLVTTVKTTYNHIFDELVDHRSDEWFLMRSPWPSVAIVALYLYFVKNGPRYMKNRPAYNLDKIICVYNILQILSSIFILGRGIELGWARKYKVFCEPVDYSNHPHAVKVARAMWYYYLLKIVDLTDTVFFILRKKQNQVTFLHVFHHGAMVLIGWIWARYIPGGHGSLAGTLNSFVHVWMYTYYFITHMWPEYKKNIWWKKYLTQLQMVQFVIIIGHMAPVFFIRNCPFPKVPCFLLLVQNVIFLALFSNFYRKSYLGKKKVS